MSKNTNYLFKLDLLILSILKDKDCYGYEMTKIISNVTNGIIVPKVGTMYPVLHELLSNNYISSYEECIGTKARVYYHIEESGEEYLKMIKDEYNRLVFSINLVVKKGEKNE